MQNINHFICFQTESKKDNVTIFEKHPGEWQTNYGPFSGNEYPKKITSSRNQLFVEFVSNEDHRGMHPKIFGFEAVFSVTKKGKPEKYSDPFQHRQFYGSLF